MSAMDTDPQEQQHPEIIEEAVEPTSTDGTGDDAQAALNSNAPSSDASNHQTAAHDQPTSSAKISAPQEPPVPSLELPEIACPPTPSSSVATASSITQATAAAEPPASPASSTSTLTAQGTRKRPSQSNHHGAPVSKKPHLSTHDQINRVLYSLDRLMANIASQPDSAGLCQSFAAQVLTTLQPYLPATAVPNPRLQSTTEVEGRQRVDVCILPPVQYFGRHAMGSPHVMAPRLDLSKHMVSVDSNQSVKLWAEALGPLVFSDKSDRGIHDQARACCQIQ